MSKTLYKKLVYHVFLKSKGIKHQTHSYFLSCGVLLDKLEVWNALSKRVHKGEFEYWESKEDHAINEKAKSEPLPTYTTGWYGAAEHKCEFNDGEF